MYKKPPKPSYSSPFIDLPVKKEWPKNYILHTIWGIGPCHQTRRLLFLTFSHQQKSSKQYFGNTGTAFITNMNIITSMLYLVIMFLKNCWTSQIRTFIWKRPFSSLHIDGRRNLESFAEFYSLEDIDMFWIPFLTVKY